MQRGSPTCRSRWKPHNNQLASATIGSTDVPATTPRPRPKASRSSPGEPPLSRAERTRERILATAERLFARHGTAGVSLNTINEAARQRNKNAIHYHFGGKNGLLQAIFAKHSPGIAERRRQLLAGLPAPDAPTLEELVQALVIPLAEKLDDPNGGSAYIHISAELIASNTMAYYLPGEHPLRINRESRLAALLAQRLQLPRLLLETRMVLATSLLFHGLSDHARIRDLGVAAPRELLDTPLLVSTLTDAILAVLSAPASAATCNLLKKRHSS